MGRLLVACASAAVVGVVTSAGAAADPPVAEASPAADTTPDEAFFDQAEIGLGHYRAGRFAEALAAFDAALTHPASSDEERATVEFNAAACLFELGRYDEAERRFLAAAALDPSVEALAQANAGLAALRAGRQVAAKQHLEAADPSDASARARVEQLRAELADAETRATAPASPPPPPPVAAPAPAPPAAPAPPSSLPLRGVHGWAALTGGYDSNAAQSGVGDTTGVSRSGRADGTALISLLGSVYYTAGLSREVAGRLYYLADGLALLARPVQELSLQGHEVGGQLYWAPDEHWLLRAGVGGGLSLSGLEAPEVLTWDGAGTGRLDWDPDGPSRSRGEVKVAAHRGAEEYDYLTGIDAQAKVGQTFAWTAVDLGMVGTVRYNGIGTTTWTLDDDDLPACEVGAGQGAGAGAATTDGCAGLDYSIPLAYVAPGAQLELGLRPSRAWEISLRGGYEFRHYLEESRIERVPSSRKQRQDHRWSAGASVEIELDRSGRLTMLGDYRLLVSSSNVAYDPTDRDHDLDYDDRTFVQHVVEGGLMVAF